MTGFEIPPFIAGPRSAFKCSLEFRSKLAGITVTADFGAKLV